MTVALESIQVFVATVNVDCCERGRICRNRCVVDCFPTNDIWSEVLAAGIRARDI